MHNQKKDNNKFKNKKQPELPENRTVWKSDNQGLKKKHSSRLMHQNKEIGPKEQIKTPEKELSDEEIANLSEAEFKTLVIRMLTEMVEYVCKIEEEVKATQSDIKENYTGNQE